MYVELLSQNYNVAKTELMHSGESQLAALTEAPNLPTSNIETTQAWNQYQFFSQHGATDSTDGLQVGYTRSTGMLYLFWLFLCFTLYIFIVLVAVRFSNQFHCHSC